jgi:hypothetical protein
MSTFGIDYSFARPAPAAIRAAGFQFACRYLDPNTTSGKGLGRPEADQLAAAGVWIVANYETTATWMLGGYAAGEAAATQALPLARAAGMPDGRPIYFSADFDAGPSQMPLISNCLNGAAAVLGRGAVGIYGGLATVQQAMESGAAPWGWQSLAWSGGAWYPGAQLRQVSVNNLVAGQAVDHDEAMTADFGQWMPGKTPGTQPPAAAMIEEDDMPQLNPGEGVQTEISMAAGAAKSIQFVCDASAIAQPAPQLRIAVHSARDGFSQIEEQYTLTRSGPTELGFSADDVDQVSVYRYAQGAAVAVGYALLT